MPTYNKDAYDISRAFGRIENELLGSMMRNMERHRAEERDYGFDWPQWQALQLQELRRYREENKEKFREDFDNINSQVESALRMAYESGQSDQEAVILDQIRRGKLEANRSFDADFFRLNNRRIDSLVEATTNDIKTAEQAILRMANDKYRQIVFDAQVYFASGGGTYEKVVDMAAHDMLMAGLNCIEYKNGARHTAADYAEMVIRTSGQRAYLRGEGQKRNEWGVHTVIVNKRGNPCPKCAPWCGKVMIDDVYAGATASEAKESGYPRVSTAMQAGFLHPRCKDTYTTWFPGVSQKPKPWTKEELASLDENARKEAEQKHAEKMAEKCGRVSRFSLDPENKRKYATRKKDWVKKSEIRLKQIVNRSKDKEQHERYRRVLGDIVPKSLESFQRMKYTDIVRWNSMKHNYRVVNSYEINAGSMSPKKILQLDDIAFNGKKGLFTGKAKNKANVAVMEYDGTIFYANSQATEITDPAYYNFKGDKSRLVLMKPATKQRFKTEVIGHKRDVDSEAKLFEFLADVVEDGSYHTVNMLSERCMCDSCLDVLKQFQERYPNVTVNVISGRKDRSKKNKNNPWKYRK